jgi:hypothetical protein
MQIVGPNRPQLDALRLYGALIRIREGWGGRLVLCCGQSVSAGIPIAVSVAGGTALVIDGNSGTLKWAMRQGALDFVVNTLDEALRVLKNEVRQHRPLSVGLIADVASASAEMAERGVQPDLLLIGRAQAAQPILQDHGIAALLAAGMPLLRMADPHGERAGTFPWELAGVRPDEVYLAAPTVAALRDIDEKLLAILPPDDIIRRRWIQRVPKYLHEARSGGRWVWLSEGEQKQLSG